MAEVSLRVITPLVLTHGSVWSGSACVYVCVCMCHSCVSQELEDEKNELRLKHKSLKKEHTELKKVSEAHHTVHTHTHTRTHTSCANLPLWDVRHACRCLYPAL